MLGNKQTTHKHDKGWKETRRKQIVVSGDVAKLYYKNRTEIYNDNGKNIIKTFNFINFFG